MDYKLIRRTIIVCSLSVLAILGIVLWMNHYEGFAGETRSTSANASGQAGADNPQQGTDSDPRAQNEADFTLNGDTRAFLRDESFWDAEPRRVSGVDSNAIRLSLIATSVQRDLRLQIVDADGALVTGEPFFIEVEGVGSYKDLDRDGIVYIRDLSAGDYRVSVAPIEGYHVSTSYMNVHVNDKVEYKAIADID
ncbi:MAG: hypothetical protein K2K87_08920, partial [Lachnospiraceae bacterium]|nr:hypothetical protein [Lachnospiraceae bacterium]